MATFGWLWGASDADENQLVEHESGASRLCNNICCAVCGAPVFLIISIFLLGWNEKRSVCNANAIIAGKAKVEEVGCNSAKAGDGHLVLFSCDLSKESLQPLHNDFPFAFRNALQNYRGTGLKVESQMYQCVEHVHSESKKDNVGGGKTTIKTYTYSLEWKSSHVDSSTFKKKQSQSFRTVCGVENPTWPAGLPTSQTLYADSAKIGSFTIPKSFIEMIELKTPILESPVGWTLNGSTYESAQWKLGGNSQIGKAKVSFMGNNWLSPKHTVLAGNKGGSINDWTAPDSWLCSGFTLGTVRAGTVDKDALFKDMASSNAALTWLLRILGFLLAWFAFSLLAGPLEVVADCIPCVGPYLGDSITCIACCVSCPPGAACSMMVIAIVWIAMRPIAGMICLLIFFAVFCTFAAFKVCAPKDASEHGRKKKEDGPGVNEVVGNQAQLPSSQESCNDFLQALADEYVNGEEGAVGAFLEQLPPAEQNALTPYEDQIRNSNHPGEDIKTLAQKWGLVLACKV